MSGRHRNWFFNLIFNSFFPAFLSSCVWVSFACAQSATTSRFLHTQGQDIVNESGQKVMVRGVGLGNWLLPEGYMWRFGNGGDRPRKIEKIISDLIGPEKAEKFWHDYRRQYVAQEDIQRIAELGFNSVRPALNARLFMSEDDGAFRDEGFELLDNLIQWCKASGVYVIIDMHAAPGGQTGQNIDDSANDQPLLFMDKQYQDRLVALWVKIATRYKDEPTVAAYDLLNEPLPQRTGAADKYKNLLEPLYKQVTQAIRVIDKRHMITVEGCDWANNWSVFTQPFDDNLVYQFHYYCWDNPTQLKSIDRYLKDRKRLGAPVWVGETGERDDTIYWATTQSFEADNIGWSFWPWKKMSGNNGPYTVRLPADWESIAAVSRSDMAAKPSAEAAQKTFDQLLENIRLKNCVYHADVVNALMRRAPCKVEAENYGQQGLNHSYFVKASEEKSKLYRKSEFVPVEAVESGAGAGGGGGRRGGGGGQAIRLSEGEWTEYDINSLEAKSYGLTIRIKTDQLPAAFKLSVNEGGDDVKGASGSSSSTSGRAEAKQDEPQKVAISEEGWHELKLNSVKFVKGANRVKLLIENGTVSVDWLDLQ